MTNEETIHKKHWHIDNGGFTFKVDKFGSLEISFGFYGYAETTIYLTAQNNDLHGKFNISSLADFFAEANFKQKALDAENK